MDHRPGRRIFLAGSAGLALAACGGGGGGGAAAPAPAPAPAALPPTPAVSFTSVSLHDPSPLRAGGGVWVFGSHLAAARTTDLMNWTSVADGVNDANPLFTKVTAALADTFAWAQVTDLWAPDVAQLEDGRYAMYYCACKGDSPRSALGLAVADAVQGPYVNRQILLKSGQAAGQPGEDGTPYDARIHPNAVDPQVFKDAAGLWWMVYGSYSGGIFILRLDGRTGLPLPGQGYGRRLMGGNHARIEGACVLHHPSTGWYYLFTSFGGLDAAGGYNVRVARSRAPDGPYVDGAGTDMATVKSDPAKPLFDDASIAPHGMKLMGNHQFALAAGETGTPQGCVSPGHNGAWIDAATQQGWIVFHTRFPNRGEVHEVRVHALHFNTDGWPVVAPLPYAPLALGGSGLAAEVTAAQAAGSYRVVNHGKAISASITASVDVTLQAGGTLAGALAGSWSHDGGNAITLTVAGTRHAGVLSRQWNPNAAAFVVTFSALSASGVALWGIRNG